MATYGEVIRTICLIPLGIAVVIGIGLALMLWGRNRLIRSIGVLLSSVLGSIIAWGASKVLFRSVMQQLVRHTPSEGDIYLIGQDITLNQLILIPLQDVGFYLVVILFFLAMLFFRRGNVVRIRTRGYTVDDLLFDWSLERFLNNRRPGAKLGGLVYRVVIVLSMLFALPVAGLIAYGMLWILLSVGMIVPIQGWIDRSILGSCILFALLFISINGVIALQDQNDSVEQQTRTVEPPE